MTLRRQWRGHHVSGWYDDDHYSGKRRYFSDGNNTLHDRFLLRTKHPVRAKRIANDLGDCTMNTFFVVAFAIGIPGVTMALAAVDTGMGWPWFWSSLAVVVVSVLLGVAHWFRQRHLLGLLRGFERFDEVENDGLLVRISRVNPTACDRLYRQTRVGGNLEAALANPWGRDDALAVLDVVSVTDDHDSWTEADEAWEAIAARSGPDVREALRARIG